LWRLESPWLRNCIWQGLIAKSSMVSRWKNKRPCMPEKGKEPKLIFLLGIPWAMTNTPVITGLTHSWQSPQDSPVVPTFQHCYIEEYISNTWTWRTHSNHSICPVFFFFFFFFFFFTLLSYFLYVSSPLHYNHGSCCCFLLCHWIMEKEINFGTLLKPRAKFCHQLLAV
jgi:hypothetical protein